MMKQKSRMEKRYGVQSNETNTIQISEPTEMKKKLFLQKKKFTIYLVCL